MPSRRFLRLVRRLFFHIAGTGGKETREDKGQEKSRRMASRLLGRLLGGNDGQSNVECA
jgi:uncharacterized membrane protein YcjF (UPF0283 family)